MYLKHLVFTGIMSISLVILVGCGQSNQENKSNNSSNVTTSTKSQSSYDKEHHLKPFNQLSLNEYIQRLNSGGEKAKNDNGNIIDTMNKDNIFTLDSSGKIAKSMSKRTINNLQKAAKRSHDNINKIIFLDSKNGKTIATFQNGKYQYYGIQK